MLAVETGRRLYRNALATVIEPGAPEACFVADLDGTRLLTVGDDSPVIPASNLKLVTAAVALEVLGADHRLTTRLAGLRNGSVIDGDLFLVGGGDATLATDDFAGYPAVARFPQSPYTSLDGLARQLRDAGVTRITGGVVADESRYDTVRYLDVWQDGIAREEAGPFSAALVNDGYPDAEADVPSGDPAAGAAEHLLAVLEANGIAVGGGAGGGTAPADLPTIAEASIELPAVLAEMLTTSDDNTAELLLKEIGLVRRLEGTTAAGLSVVADVLGEWGIPLDGVELFDGSGLANRNRLRCSTVTEVLERSGAAGPVFDGLAIAGRSGTLRDAFLATELEDVLRGKTGTLTGARALSGFVPGEHTLTFSLILNGAGAAARADEAWARLADALGRVPPIPTAEQLAPGA